MAKYTKKSDNNNLFGAVVSRGKNAEYTSELIEAITNNLTQHAINLATNNPEMTLMSDRFAENALHWALKNKNYGLAGFLATKFPHLVGQCNKYGETPLFLLQNLENPGMNYRDWLCYKFKLTEIFLDAVELSPAFVNGTRKLGEKLLSAHY